MRRIVIAVTALAFVAVACGDDAPVTASTVATTSTSSTTTTTLVSVTTTTTTTTTASSATSATTSEATITTTTRVRPEGDDAPDFTIELGEGGSFTLSEEQKPVYMIFWAEW